MADKLLFDMDQVDCTKVLFDRERIYSLLPQKHEFMQLDGGCFLDREVG